MKLKPGVNGEDIVFGAYNGDEIMRVDTSASRLLFRNDSGDEAIYGDGTALYLLSNGHPMKLPTAAPGANGYSLIAQTDGTCSWSDVSGGGGGSGTVNSGTSGEIAVYGIVNPV